MTTKLVTALCGLALLAGCADLADESVFSPQEEDELEPVSGPSAALLQEAERFVAAVAATPAADWADAQLTGEAIPLYRPDLEEPAYYELAVRPEGFVVVATGDHDWRIAHWSTKGLSPSARLRANAGPSADAIEHYYKLDTLTYVAEDSTGQLVAQLGALPQQIVADPEESGVNYERSWLPEVDADGNVIGGEIITRRATSVEVSPLESDSEIVGREVVTGDNVETVRAFAHNVDLRPFDSWQDLKAQYAGAFRPQLDALRASASAQLQLVDIDTAPTPTEAPEGTLRSTGYTDGFYWWSADGNAAALTYNQIPAYTWPNTSPCKSGCGATAWAMLFGWADREAAANTFKWQNHKGIYRQDGGYGEDVEAPTNNTLGVNLMKMELRARIGTFCWENNGATYPVNMIYARGYLAYRDHSPIYTTFNSLGQVNAGNTQAAINVIMYEQSPVIIGTGFFQHYPLAHTVTWNPQYGSFFLVNQGEEGRGTSEAIPTASWFHGQLVWVP